MPARRPHKADRLQSPTQWLGIGLEFGAVLAVFSYGGYRLDRALQTEPWFLLGGFLVAFIGMLYSIIRRALKEDKTPRERY